MSAVEGLVPFVHVLDVMKSTALYELEELHRQLGDAGLDPGPIVSGAPGPDRQFRIADPDGSVLMVTDATALTAPPRP